MGKKKKKFRMSKLIVPFVIISIFSFTGLAIWLQFTKTMELSATLITCFFAFCGTELLALASIEKTKIKNHQDLDGDGVPDDEDDYVDPQYIKEVEEALEKLKNKMKNGGEG
jgi:hypothetical protein